MGGSSVANEAEGEPMGVAPTVGLALALLIAACSSGNPAPPGAQPPSTAEAVAPAASSASAPSPPARAAATPSAAATLAPANPLKPANPPVALVGTAGESAVTPAAPAAKASAAATPKAAVAQPSKTKITASNVAKKKALPTLDLKSLEQRLTDTNAIGVLTKIALKNQVDDLLDQFRAFYQGTLKTSLAELRRPYDLLVLKVLALLQDSDPSLASAIVASREAIWGILADRAKFATVS
jgi:hypothetical protein